MTASSLAAPRAVHAAAHGSARGYSTPKPKHRHPASRRKMLAGIAGTVLDIKKPNVNKVVHHTDASRVLTTLSRCLAEQRLRHRGLANERDVRDAYNVLVKLSGPLGFNAHDARWTTAYTLVKRLCKQSGV